MNNHTSIDSWEESFDELSFDGNSLLMILITGLGTLVRAEIAEKVIKDRISTILKQERTAVLEEVIEAVGKYYKEEDPHDSRHDIQWVATANTLDDILFLLNEKKDVL